MEFANLSDIIIIEIRNAVADQKGSASSSLLWLVRYLMFIHEFLRRFAESDINTDTLIKDCLSCAYENCLRKYHSPVIHNIFSVSLKTCLKSSHCYKRDNIMIYVLIISFKKLFCIHSDCTRSFPLSSNIFGFSWTNQYL